MGSLYKFISSQYQVWDACKLLGTDAIDVTEIWQHHDSQKRVIRHRLVSLDDVDAWLHKTSETFDGIESSILLRLVWVTFHHVERIKYISHRALDALLRHFCIELAHEWNWTRFAGSTGFSDSHRLSGPLFSYSICNHPKVATAWSYSPLTGITQGIYYAGSSQIPELQGLVQSLVEIASHPMLTALVFATSMSGQVEQEHKSIKDSVRAVEVRTRFHSWSNRNEAPAEGDYVSLSAMITGAKTRLANLCRRTRILHEICDFIWENLHTVHREGYDVKNPLPPSHTDIAKLINEYTRVLEKRTLLQEADVQFFQHRADAQLVTHARINTNIASATQQDSSSLRTLSLVTMFFLPGTFLATLFSVPLLKWNSETIVDRKFWIYWAFAVPLTLMTFGTWWIWTSLMEGKLIKERKQQKLL
ncbi:hypothetical protein BDV59DRAFT_192625 [Aspergillus ambiguus]|uniref:uncharacterized protein n=1 Tax=Aspergillus ambiguus TaxID=176160 RepID=UPI003CCDEA04